MRIMRPLWHILLAALAATVFVMEISWLTPTEAPRWMPYIALSEGMTEREAIEWLERRGR